MTLTAVTWALSVAATALGLVRDPAVLLYFSFAQLGDPDWRVREAATVRADCPLGAVLAPVVSPDAEVMVRIDAVRDRQARRWYPLAVLWAVEYPAALVRHTAPRHDLLPWTSNVKMLHLYRFLPLPNLVELSLQNQGVGYGVDWVTAAATWNRPAVRRGILALGGGATDPTAYPR